MMEKEANGAIFITKGTPFPFSCPVCDAIIPYNSKSEQICWACSYRGLTENFDCEWDFTPATRQ